MKSKRLIAALTAVVCCTGNALMPVITYASENRDKVHDDSFKGDANCDGQVDLSDAVMIMQALANPNKYGIDGTAEHHLTEQGKINGDMNGDGLTVGDAQAIQRMLLGLDIDDPDDYDMVFGYDDFNSGKPLPSATIIIKSKSSCVKGEKLKIDAAMGDIVLNSQNYDTAGEYEYDVYASDGIEDHKLEDNALIINGVHGEYTKEYSKDDAKQFVIGNKFENLDSYHHEITEIDFSDYKAGSTGCITFSFYSKHINDLDSGVSTDGTKRFIYYYVGEKGTAIGDSIENAKKAYEVAFADADDYDMVFGYDDFNSGKPLPSATIIIKSKSSCVKGEKLKIDAAMGDIVLNSQNYDTAGEYEYDVYASDGIEDHKLEDNALIINGVHGEYTKEYSKDDAKQFDIGNKFENLDSYHHEITEIDFSDYRAGSTGCITFSFYSKHINDLDSGVSTDGTKRFIYYYVGEKGTAIGDSIENAKKAYKVAFNDSPEEILNYNEKTVDWYHGGNELEDNYWNIVYNNYSAVISDTDELKEYLEIVYREEVISKYLEKYDDIYFKNNVLLINSIYQPFGSEKPIYVIDSVTCLDKAIDINIKTIENGGDDMISVCLAQVAIPKDEYNNKAVNWNIMEYRDTSDIVNDDIDNSEYLIGNEDVSSAASTTQKLVLNCNSFCANGETLKVDMAMGDMYTYFQTHNGYPNYDSAGNPEYAVFTTENLKKIDDERLIINGEKSEYTKSFSKEDMESLDITGKDGDYAAYYHESAEIDFSNYEAGSTGSITFRFGWKADGENPLNASSDFIGMHQTMYFYIGENGTGISNNGIEAAQKAYEDKSDNDIMFYDSIYVKWNGKEVMSNLYDVLRKPSDEVLPISFKLSMSPDYNFEYKGKKLSEYANANYNEEMNKLKDLLMYGNQLQYGETIYTTGMPDGTKRTKEWYEERIEYFGKELLSKYIVDGKFLDENLRADINELTKNNRTVYKEAENAYYSYISDEAIKQLDEQNIRYKYLTEPKRLVIYVTAEEFKYLTLDNVLRYGLDISLAKGLSVDAIL